MKAATLLLLALSSVAQPLDQLLEKRATELLDARRTAISALNTPQAVAARQRTVREKILASVGNFPAHRTPLNARVTGTIQRDGYRIEKVIFESQPKFFVTANLYLPDGIYGPLPAVLGTAGHSVEGKANPTYQHVWISLARRGFVVLAYDPPGQGERLQYWDSNAKKSLIGVGTGEHTLAGLQCLLTGSNYARHEIWDGVRGFDYLLTRAEVDPKRIAAIGNSGGGTQSAYLAALEPRLAAAAPSCYITNWRKLWFNPGPQDSEQLLAGFLSEGLDFGDLLLPLAPKPLLILSAIRDYFPIDGARSTFAEMQRLYKMIDAPGRVDFFEHDDEHGYSKPRREATYKFLARWLQDREDDGVEGAVTPEYPDLLNATPTGQIADSLGGETVHSLNLAMARAMFPRRTASRIKNVALMRQIVRARLHMAYFPKQAPVAGAAEWIELGSGFKLTGFPLSSNSREAYQTSMRAVLVGQSLLGIWTEEVLRAIDARDRPVSLRGTGVPGVVAMLAAFLSDRVVGLDTRDTPPSWMSLVEQLQPDYLREMAVPGVLEGFDLPDLEPFLKAKRVR